jgi:hypothetical protein
VPRKTDMAIATEEMTDEQTQTEETQTETTNSEPEGKRKRAKVDLDSLNDNDKVIVSFNVPAGMRKLFRTNSDAAKVSEAKYLRDLLATELGYAVPAEFDERGRKSTAGLSEEEKKAQNDAKRKNVAAILAAIAANPDLANTLAAQGIDVTNLPKSRAPKE